MMNTIVNLSLLLFGLIILVKGSDYFVKSASSIAKVLGVSDFVIGLTIVAIGTSIPELASSVAAAFKGSSGLIIGNVVGSNIANIGLIIGLASIVAVIKTDEEMLKRDGYIMILASVSFLVFIYDGTISMIEAVIFLLLYFAYIMFLLQIKSRYEVKYHFREFIEYFLKFKYISGLYSKQSKDETSVERGDKKELSSKVLVLIISLTAVIIGARFLIESTIYFANLFDIPETLVGISLIAVGTSLPELSISLSAVKKGMGNIVVGNIIGSNIANIFLVLGVSGLILPVTILRSTVLIITPFLIFISVLLLVFIKSDWEVRRYEGIIFVLLYFAFIAIVFLLSL